MDLNRLKNYLNTVHRIGETTWNVLAPLFVKKNLIKGEHFIKIGSYAKKIAFLDEGYLRGYYRHLDGTEYNKHFFKSPAFIGGYSSLVTGNPTQIGLVHSKWFLRFDVRCSGNFLDDSNPW